MAEDLGYNPSNPVAEPQTIFPAKKDDPKLGAMIIFALIVGVILGKLFFGGNDKDWKQLKTIDDEIIQAFSQDGNEAEASRVLVEKGSERNRILNKLGY